MQSLHLLLSLFTTVIAQTCQSLPEIPDGFQVVYEDISMQFNGTNDIDPDGPTNLNYRRPTATTPGLLFLNNTGNPVSALFCVSAVLQNPPADEQGCFELGGQQTCTVSTNISAVVTYDIWWGQS
ncbi:hypothetical protein LX36DRAFT_263514 [Colletotrichum falcatum]|nr:hypothetical protein LX36DRAFT_263514 [Colletotrichum falcatum]